MSNHDAIDNLDFQIAELQKKKQDLLAGMRKDALKQARELVGRFEFTASELGLHASAHKTAKMRVLEARYANPANSSQTWHGGKGPRPKWVKEHLQQGGLLSDLEIK